MCTWNWKLSEAGTKSRRKWNIKSVDLNTVSTYPDTTTNTNTTDHNDRFWTLWDDSRFTLNRHSVHYQKINLFINRLDHKLEA